MDQFLILYKVAPDVYGYTPSSSKGKQATPSAKKEISVEAIEPSFKKRGAMEGEGAEPSAKKAKSEPKPSSKQTLSEVLSRLSKQLLKAGVELSDAVDKLNADADMS